MPRSPKLWPVLVLLGAAVACDSGRHSSAGFRLPLDGDVESGKATFVAMGCHQCHEVSGMELPKPVTQPAVMVALGGSVPREVTDGYLVTSIMNPSYVLAAYPRELITAGGRSRMPDYRDRMTVRQLVDTVAFLQSRYTVVPPSRVAYR